LLALFHWTQASLGAPSHDSIVFALLAVELLLLVVLVVIAWRISSRRVVRARQFEALAELSQRGMETDDLSDLFDLVVSRVGLSLGTEFVEILELQGNKGGLRLSAGRGFHSGMVGSEVFDLEHSGRVERALNSGKPVVMRPGARERRLLGDALLTEHGVHSGITAPIPGRGSGFGTLGAHTRKQRRFHTDDTYFLEAIASLLGIAIESRRTDQEARTNQRNLAFLNEASRQLAFTLDPDAVLKTLSGLALPFLSDFLLIDLVGKDGELQRLVGACSDPKSASRAADPEKGTRLQLVAAAEGRVDAHRARYASEATEEELQRIAADPEQFELLRRADLSSVLIVPLSAPQRVLGSLCLGARPPRASYGPAELALAGDLARRAALALDKAPLHKEAAEEEAEVDSREREFRAMLSRKLRDSIATLNNTIQVLRLGEADSSKSRGVERAAGQMSGMNRLVADLLDVSSTGGIELHREPVELGVLAQRAIESARWVEASQEIELTLPDAPLWVDGDSVRLEQVIATLVGQTASHGHGTTIRVRIDDSADQKWGVVRIFRELKGVSPTGPSPSTKPSARALPIEPSELAVDLYLVECLTELHGGEVSVQDRGANGETEFVVRLPQISVPAWSATSHSGKPEETSGLRVLVVDDHQDLATGLAELLERWGHEARVAFDGPSGLEAARGFQPDLLLLDLGLPGMDGYAVAQTLRQEPSLSSMEVVALTGYAHADDRRKARESGVDHYFTKPVDLDSLRRLLEGRMGMSRRARMELEQ
jgi:CheY-like chemotaxis protein/GAF domain-containing protein